VARALAELTLEELRRLFPIQLREYDQRYPLWFTQEAERLGDLLKRLTFRLSHIGSTAVPGLLSKPIIDLLLEVSPETPEPRAGLAAVLEADRPTGSRRK
jgi:GrpB-like predicted nucleotidyltransferase (UPF0157 family)